MIDIVERLTKEFQNGARCPYCDHTKAEAADVIVRLRAELKHMTRNHLTVETCDECLQIGTRILFDKELERDALLRAMPDLFDDMAEVAIRKTLASDEPPEQLSNEDVRERLGIAWTPTDGMLVERISDGACFRVEIIDWPGEWHLDPINPEIVSFDVAGTLNKSFRPRFLQVGDVIEKVSNYPNHTAVGLGITELSEETAYAYMSYFDATDEITVKGLGVVPWPPKEEA